MPDTYEQTLAQSLDRRLAVTANAGSGKTRALVGRYVNAILYGNFSEGAPESIQGIPVSSVTAITFTRKAASEMLSKAVKKIESMIKKAERRSELEKLKKVREGLTYARIMTIHSFCSGLMRDFPLEAGVLPNFSEIPKADYISLKRDSVIAALEDWMDSDDSRKRNNAAALLNELGWNKTEELFSKLIDNPEFTRRFAPLYRDGAHKIIEIRENYIKSLYYEEIKEALIFLQGLINASIGPEESQKTAIKLRGAALEIDGFLKKAENNSFSSQLEMLDSAAGIFSEIFNTSNKIPKFLNDRIPENEMAEKASDIGNKFDFLAKGGFDEAGSLLDMDMAHLASIAFEIAEDISDLIEEKKLESGGVTFSDMIIKANEILSRPEVASTVRKGISHLMIDEFQDTDSLQYEIVKKIAPRLDNPQIELPEEEDVNIFIVGDAKQSIYGFRNADVRVFKEAEEDIRRLNKKLIDEKMLSEIYEIIKLPEIKETGRPLYISPEAESHKEGAVELTATFRLAPAIAAFVNQACGPMMDSGDSEYDTPYSPFTCGRNVEFFEKKPEEGPAPGHISFLISEKKYNAGIESGQDGSEEISEEELLAKYIMSITSEKSGIKIPVKNGERHLKFGDIAILSRKSSKFGELSGELSKYNIPYLIYGGSDFYKTQEVLDIISFLNFARNQNDSLALFSILKSPFFGLPNTQLFNIVNTISDKPGYYSRLIKYAEKIKQEGKSESHESSKVIRAQRILGEILSEAPSLQVSGLIKEILERTAWHAAIANSPDKRQKYANIDKILDMARDFDRKGFKGFYDFTEELNFLISEKVKEPEAPFASGQNAVNIFTVHSSKGLEFPAVILYDSNSKAGISESYYLDDNLGLCFSANKLDENGIPGPAEPPLKVLAGMKDKIKSAAEEKRIFYVALTRAMDLLAISGNFKRTKTNKIENRDTLFRQAIEALGLAPEELFELEYINMESPLHYLKNGKAAPSSIKYKINIVKDIEAEEINNSRETSAEEPRILIPGLAFHDFTDEFYSPSKYNLFFKDKEEYFRNYALGLPTGSDESYSAPIYGQDASDDDIIGARAGSLIHKVLERISAWAGESGAVDETSLDAAIKDVIRNIELNIAEKIRRRIRTECISVLKTELLQNSIMEIKKSHSEYSLIMPFGEDFLTGSIDLLFENKHGEKEIWDWKTNKVSSPEEMPALFKKYETQFKIYALLAQKLTKQKSVTVKMLCTRLARPGVADAGWVYETSWESSELGEYESFLARQVPEIKELSLRLGG